MLTKGDLAAIKDIVREEIEVEAKTIRDEIKYDIFNLKTNIYSEFKEVKSRLKDLEIGTRKIQSDLKTTINFFDKGYLGLKKRVDVLEAKSNLQ